MKRDSYDKLFIVATLTFLLSLSVIIAGLMTQPQNANFMDLQDLLVILLVSVSIGSGMGAFRKATKRERIVLVFSVVICIYLGGISILRLLLSNVPFMG